jgi:predicted nucleic acid-binding protein
MPSGPVVLNNTPLVALWSLGRLDLLQSLFQEVLIPQAVEEEFLATDDLARRRALSEAPWIRTVELSHPRRALAYLGLDRGEAAVLALAEETDASLVVIDERKARRFATRMDLSLTGTLGVLLAAKKAGLIGSVSVYIDQLRDVGLFLSPELVQKFLEIAGEES